MTRTTVVVLCCVAIAGLALLCRGNWRTKLGRRIGSSEAKWRSQPDDHGALTHPRGGGGRPWPEEEGHSGPQATSARNRRGQLADAQPETAYATKNRGKVLGHRRAPRNYWRTDERVREDICDRLMMNDHIDASDVSVAVRDGIVILEGSVPERRMRYVAEDLAAEGMGAIDVENRIRVTRPDEVR